ncbi:MAG: diguanylate cyclase [bacterium]|nr:diguanylate cyclase [bacterium]
MAVWRNIGIRTKLIVTLAIILFFAFFITNLISFQASKKALHTNLVMESLPLVSDNIYSQIQHDILRPVHLSSLMANDTFVRDWITNGEEDVAAIQTYLKEIKDKYDFSSAFLVSDRTKKYYYYGGVLKTISPTDDHDVWYYQFLVKNKEYLLDVDTDQAAANNITIFINYRINDSQGRLLGVTGVGLSMKRIGSLLKEHQGRTQREIFLVDAQGVVQVHPDITKVEKVNVFDQDGIRDFIGRIQNDKDQTAAYEFDRDGNHIVLTVRYIPEFNWYLFVEQDESLVLSDIRKTLIRNLLIGFFVSCLILLINLITVDYFQRRLVQAANMDSLTGVYNRKMFWEQGGNEFNRCKRYRKNMAVLMMDLDHFKRINDTYGHLRGDEALKAFVRECRKNLRETDLFGRLGGEEFAVILTESNSRSASTVAERIRSAIEAMRIFDGKQEVRVTVSIGVTEFDEKDQNLEQIISRADQAMYRAKKRGRNRVEYATAAAQAKMDSMAGGVSQP